MYVPTENRLGIQPINQSSSTLNHQLGTLLRARDETYGEGEFIYLLGCVGTAVGSVVIWEGQSAGTPTYQTAIAPATVYLGQPVAAAMAANGAGQFGWYQIGGSAVTKTNGTVAANSSVYLAGSGQITTTVAGGLQVLDAISLTGSGSPSSGLAVIEIDRPFAQGTGAASGGIVPPRSSGTVQNPLITDVEFAVDTRTNAVTVNLPGAVAWAAANPSGLDLCVVDYFGNAATNNITPSLNAGDSFQYGVTPKVTMNYGTLRLRPVPSLPGWYVRGVNV